MDCVTCATPRPDRPHTFLYHAPSRCQPCGAEVEARVVERDGAIVALKLCLTCGQTEERLSDDAAAHLDEFLAVPANIEGEHLFKRTTSTCPECLALVPADVMIRDGKVVFVKSCPAHGRSEALVSEDAAYYVNAYRFARAGTEPHRFRTEVQHGCPTDCGTCADHEQHTCLPIIEITDHCNLECPICIVNNQYSRHITVEEFTAVIDRLVEAEGEVESIALSGGEPTSHPQLFELIAIASRPEIARIVLITNGLRIGREPEFARRIKESGCYVALQLDGFSAETHRLIRGRDLTAEKNAALAMLKELCIPTQLIFVATRGVNEHQIGTAVRLLLDEDHILSLNFQPAAYTGLGGGSFAHDPLDRLTIPGVIRRIEEQLAGELTMGDFAPLPCSHPQCVSLTYLLRLDDGSFVPFARFADFHKHGALLRSSATIGASPEMEQTLKDVIYDVYANQDTIARAPEILKALRRAVDVMFPERPLGYREQVAIGERQAKSIVLHHYMDRHDFDLERLRKCCHHYPQIDGRVMPACGFNMFHRGAAKGANTPLPAWGKKPWTAGDRKHLPVTS